MPRKTRAEQFGAWLRARRQQLNFSLRESARRGDISYSMLSQLETGHHNLYSMQIRAITKLSGAYMVTPEALLRRLGILGDM